MSDPLDGGNGLHRHRVRRKRRSERQDTEGVDWGRIVLAWSVGLGVRALALAISWVCYVTTFGPDLPPMAQYLKFVPGAAACSLVAAAIYPKYALLAALVPLFLPPDYAAPLGLLAAYAYGRARIANARAAVTLATTAVVIVLCALAFRPDSSSARRAIDLRPLTRIFLEQAVLQRDQHIVWQEGDDKWGPDGRVILGSAGAGTIGLKATIGLLPIGPGLPDQPDDPWPRDHAVEATQIDVDFPQFTRVGTGTPLNLAAAGLLRPEFARQFRPAGTNYRASNAYYNALCIPAYADFEGQHAARLTVKHSVVYAVSPRDYY